ncbi:MAG: hypothetical protein PHG35_02360 [Dehalococcoidales bacterium]|nr:hypothetical protein [Dehalococcoidales bacterium]
MKMLKYLGIGVMLLSVAALVIGVVFIAEGIMKNNLIVDRMNIEQVSLNLDPEHPDVFTPINNADDAQKAADIIAEHRRSIAPTYQDLLNQGTGRFDPTNPDDLTYAQAMNLENYLYMAVTAFGLIQVTIANGVFMVVVALAIGVVGFLLWRFSRMKFM